MDARAILKYLKIAEKRGSKTFSSQYNNYNDGHREHYCQRGVKHLAVWTGSDLQLTTSLHWKKKP